VTAASNAVVPLSGLALEIAVSARSGKSRFEIRRSGRSRPHRCPHRCRSQRPGHRASHGRKAGDAVDAAPGRVAAATRAG
jgi:hypothetical protein